MKYLNQWIHLGAALTVLISFATMPALAFAQDSNMQRLSDSSLGFELNSLSSAPGFGLVYTTAYSQHHVAMRVHYSQNLYNGIPLGKTNEITSSYSDLRLGFVGVSNDISQGIRLYGEGGFEEVLPDPQMSDKNVLGAYGLLGFEFFIHGHRAELLSSYYIELGASGTVAHAEKMTGEPAYLPGFTIAAGWKYYF